MRIHSHSLAELAQLADAIDIDTDDWTRLLDRLLTDIEHAVASVVSMTLSVQTPDDRVDLTASCAPDDHHTAEAHTAVATSMHVTITDGRGTRVVTELAVRAAVPGALVDLAADLNFSLPHDHLSVMLDCHLDEPGPPRYDDDVREMNRAVGVLIDSGRTPTEGRAEIHRLAARTGDSAGKVSRRILNDALGWYPPPPENATSTEGTTGSAPKSRTAAVEAGWDERREPDYRRDHGRRRN